MSFQRKTTPLLNSLRASFNAAVLAGYTRKVGQVCPLLGTQLHYTVKHKKEQNTSPRKTLK